MTRKLFYEFPLGSKFTTQVVECRPREDGAWSVTLEQTAFYPTSGGQPYDGGRLGDRVVIEVIEEGSQVVHVLPEPLPEGATVDGCIDWSRRIDHCQQHTGQHILSRALETLGGKTIGFHLGEERCSIDLDTILDLGDLEEGERLANEIVMGDREVEIQWHDDESTIPPGLRSELPEERPIRLVHIQDFDINPCCGTHCQRTGQVGPIKILRWEKRKEGQRVEFLCGWRAVEDYAKRHETLRRMALDLTTDEFLVGERVSALMDSQKEFKNRLEKMEKELLDYRCSEWSRDADLPLIQNIGGSMEKHLTRTAGRLLESGVTAALLYCENPENIRLVFASSHQEINAGTILQHALAQVGGRGGGNPSVAQGSVPATQLEPLQELIRKAVQDAHGNTHS